MRIVPMNIGIEPDAEPLRQVLSETIAMTLIARRMHWDVTGENFGDLHEYWDDEYAQLTEMQDEVAERIRALGAFTNITLQEVNRSTTEFDLPDTVLEANQMVEMYYGYLGLFISHIRLVIKTYNDTLDFATANWLTEKIHAREKALWKARAILEGGEDGREEESTEDEEES